MISKCEINRTKDVKTKVAGERELKTKLIEDFKQEEELISGHHVALHK